MFLLFSQSPRASIARRHFFGANIDINLKSCKYFRKYFRKKPKKMSKIRQYAEILTFPGGFFLCLRWFSVIGE